MKRQYRRHARSAPEDRHTSPNISRPDHDLSHPPPGIRTGDTWCVYPILRLRIASATPWSHITHSLCTLGFRRTDRSTTGCSSASSNRQAASGSHPADRVRATEPGLHRRGTAPATRLVEGTNMSMAGTIRFWTLAGLRRRGFTPASIRLFAKRRVYRAHRSGSIWATSGAARRSRPGYVTRGMAVLDPIPRGHRNYRRAI